MSTVSPDDHVVREPGCRILVLTPFGRDAVEICHVLAGDGFVPEPCEQMEAVCHEIVVGACALIVAEEALSEDARSRLTATLGEQPGWSDFPVVILTSRSRDNGAEWQVLRGISGTAHVSLLERPLHVSTLISCARTAIRARERQYQVRDALAARERAESELWALNRTLEARVRERTADLEARNRDLKNFAYVASHDLREPLRKIQTFADLVLHEATGTLGGDARFFLERMAAAAVRMDGLINDLVDFARVDTQANIRLPVPLNDLVADVLGDFEVTIRKKHAEIQIDADVTVDGHRAQLRQLLTNLIGNALKFHRADSPPRIGIYAGLVHLPHPNTAAVSSASPDSIADSRLPATSTSAGSPVCRIVVEDDGVGFDSKFADRIFDPFERLHGQDSYEGTGMGLAICKRIVQVHGGTITAHSTPGGGSRFEVRLPINGQDSRHVHANEV